MEPVVQRDGDALGGDHGGHPGHHSLTPAAVDQERPAALAGLVGQVAAVVAVAAPADVGGVDGHAGAEQRHHDLEHAAHGGQEVGDEQRLQGHGHAERLATLRDLRTPTPTACRVRPEL